MWEPIVGKDENGGGGTDVTTDWFSWLEEGNICCCWKFDWGGGWPKQFICCGFESLTKLSNWWFSNDSIRLERSFFFNPLPNKLAEDAGWIDWSKWNIYILKFYINYSIFHFPSDHWKLIRLSLTNNLHFKSWATFLMKWWTKCPYLRTTAKDGLVMDWSWNEVWHTISKCQYWSISIININTNF